MRRGRFGWWALGAVTTALVTVGCGSSDDAAGAPDTAASASSDVLETIVAEPAPTDAVAATDASPSPGAAVYLRPVLQCVAATPTTDGATSTVADAVGDPNATEVLPLQMGGYCQVGPQRGTAAVFEPNATADIVSGGWAVTVSLRPGADGEDVWNAVASECYSGAPSCPSHQLAIEVDGLIVSAPTVNAPSFSGNVEISGAFTEPYARELAAIVNDLAAG